MSGNIFNSNGAHVGVVNGADIFDLKGHKIYHLKGINIYRLSGELVGHLNAAQVPTSGSIGPLTTCSPPDEVQRRARVMSKLTDRLASIRTA